MTEALGHSPSGGKAQNGLEETVKRMVKKGLLYLPDPRVQNYFNQTDPADLLTTLYDELQEEEVVANNIRVGLAREGKDDPPYEDRIIDAGLKLEIISRLVIALVEPTEGKTPLGSLNSEGLAIGKEIIRMRMKDEAAYTVFTESIVDLLIHQEGASKP